MINNNSLNCSENRDFDCGYGGGLRQNYQQTYYNVYRNGGLNQNDNSKLK